LIALRCAVDARLPRVDLPELVLEIQARTGFADAFCHASEARARAQDIATSVCAVLVSEACNTGLEPMIRSDVGALRRSRLGWVKQNYIRADTLTAANAKLVAAQNSIGLVRAWGGGEVALLTASGSWCLSEPSTRDRTHAISAASVASPTTTCSIYRHQWCGRTRHAA
jgi:hypothetical protein